MINHSSVARRPCGLLEPDARKAGTSGSEGAPAQQCAGATRRFHHHKVESWKWRGHWYLQRWPSPRAMSSIRDKVRAATDRRFVGVPLEMVVANLNRTLRGWAAYFRYGNSGRKFTTIDSYVHERLAILASTKHGLPGRNWQRRFTTAWLDSLGVYRLHGKVRWGTAHARR